MFKRLFSHSQSQPDPQQGALSGREPALGGKQPAPDEAPALGGEALLLHTIEALADKDWQIRMRAVESLGRINSERALETLGSAVRDSSPQVRQRAADALGRLGSDAALQLLLGVVNGETIAADALAVGLSHFPRPEAIEQLILTLDQNSGTRGNQEAATRMRVIASLVSMGGIAAPWLINALRHENPSVASAALQALGKIGGQISDAAERERYYDAIVPLTDHRHYSVNNAAYLALGQLRDPRALPLLAEQLADSPVQASSVHARTQALGEMGTLAVQTILNGLISHHGMTRHNAAGAFRYLTPDAIPTLVDQLVRMPSTQREITISRIMTLNEASTQVLRPLLDSDIRAIRLVAAAIISQLNGGHGGYQSRGEAVTLQDTYEHSDPEVRRRAAMSYSSYLNWRYPNAYSLMLNLLRDVNRRVRMAAIRSISRYADWDVRQGRTEAMPVLIDALYDPALGIRLEAARALRYFYIGIEAENALIAVLRGGDRAMHSVAAASLRNHRSEAARHALIEATGSTYTTITRRKAIRALSGQRHSECIAPMLMAMQDRNHNIRSQAVHSLGILIQHLSESQWQQSINALRLGLLSTDPTVRLHSAYNLAYLGAPDGADVLVSAFISTDDPPYLTREAIQAAMNRIS